MATDRSLTIPAPIGGWNASDPIAAMPETDAIRMINFFPERGKISLRKGFRSHSTGHGAAVYSIFSYNADDGTSDLISCANGKIWNSTTFNAAATQLATGFSVNKWQATNFKNRLFLVNGTDDPQTYDGSTVAASAWTGISNDAVLINVSAFKERLYFVEKNSTSVWWANTVGAVTGQLNELDVGSFLRLGGKVVFGGSYSGNTGQGLEDLFVVISDQGEALVYSGSFPTASNWGLAFENINADLVAVTEAGTFPLSTIFSDKLALQQDNSLTNKINEALNAYAKDYGINYGWEIKLHTASRFAIINIPISTTVFRQAVVNMLSGSWCEYRGWNFLSFVSCNGKLYGAGTDGVIYECDYGFNDDGDPIEFEVKWAFNYLGNPGQYKLLHKVMPLMLAENEVEFGFGADPAFEDNALDGVVNLEGAIGTEWDTEPWDSFPWGGGTVYNKNWHTTPTASNVGAVAFKMKGSVLDTKVEIFGLQVIYENGGAY
jgi:hypothetical protein